MAALTRFALIQSTSLIVAIIAAWAVAQPAVCTPGLRFPTDDLELTDDATVVIEWRPRGCAREPGLRVVAPEERTNRMDPRFLHTHVGDVTFFVPPVPLRAGDVAAIENSELLKTDLIVGTSTLPTLTLPPRASVADARWSQPGEFGERVVQVQLFTEVPDPEWTSMVAARLTPPGPEVQETEFFDARVVDGPRRRPTLEFQQTLSVGAGGVCFVVYARDLRNRIGPGVEVCATNFALDPSLNLPPEEEPSGCQAVAAPDVHLSFVGLVLVWLTRKRPARLRGGDRKQTGRGVR